MKKFIIILLGLALAIPSFADTVSENKATEAAAAFFNKGVATRSAVKPFLVWTGGNGTRAPYAPPFYVFNNPNGGWVVISGEDSGRAILAWSDKGVFDPITLPDNAAAWFEEYANQINWARARQLTPSDASLKEWSDLLEGRIRRTAVKDLGTAKWNQSSPYNQLCPKISGDRCPTGCVATAMAIIMRYYEYPDRGTGTIGGYTQSPSVDEYGTTAPTVVLDNEETFSWEDMPLQNVGSGSDFQKAEVARLMWYCGLSVEMQYKKSGSSSSQYKIQKALIDNFDYDPSMRIIDRAGYTHSQWWKLFKDELDADRPIIVAGHSAGSSGHEFIAEGYDNEDGILLNFGWGNSSQNGFYSLTAFRPYESDDPSGNYDFRYTQSVLVGIKINVSGASSYNLKIPSETAFQLLDDNQPNLLSPETYFKIKCSVTNLGGKGITTKLRVVVTDYAGNIYGISSKNYWNRSFNPQEGWARPEWECNLRNRETPAIGDQLKLTYENAEETNIVINDIRNSIPIFDIPFIAVKDDGHYSVGDYFDFEIVNSRTARSAMTVEWSFDGTPVEIDEATKQASRKLTAAGEHTIKAVVTIGGESQTLVQKILVE